MPFVILKKSHKPFENPRTLGAVRAESSVGVGIFFSALRAKEVLVRVGLGDKLKNKPSQLSGGQMQRVAIARALIKDPKIIFADEPTGNLDPDTSMGIMKVLEDINKMGTTIIMSTHNRDIVNKMKKRVIVLNEGKIVQDYERGKYYEVV